MPSTDLLSAWILLSCCDTWESKNAFVAERFATWHLRSAFLVSNLEIDDSYLCCLGSLGGDVCLDWYLALLAKDAVDLDLGLAG